MCAIHYTALGSRLPHDRACVGLTPVGSERSARTRLWPFAHSPPTPPLIRPAAPRTPRKHAHGGRAGQRQTEPARQERAPRQELRAKAKVGEPPMCPPAASDGCLDRRAGFEPVPAVVPHAGPSARAKREREEAVWVLRERRLCFSSNRQAPRAPDLRRCRETHSSGLTARSCSVGFC